MSSRTEFRIQRVEGCSLDRDNTDSSRGIRALILAAGFGTRLEKGYNDFADKDKVKHLVWDAEENRVKHKGLVIVGNKSIVELQLEQLRNAGISLQDIYLHTNNAYHQQYCSLARKVGIPLKNVSNNGVNCNEERLEQMGDLLLSLKNIGSEKPLLVMACDTLVYGPGNQLYDLSKMVNSYMGDGFSRLIVYQKFKDLSRHGIIQADASGQVLSFEEKPLIPRSDLVNASIYLFSPECLRQMLEYEAEFRKVKNPIELIWKSFKIEKVERRLDIGTLEEVMKVNGV